MTLIERVVRLRRSCHGLLSRRITEVSELSFQQLLLLRYVSRGIAQTQAELADRLVIDAAATCRLVQRLEQQGLLVRHKGEDRCMRLEVTEAARPHIELLGRELADLDRRLRAHLGDEEAALLESLLDKAQDCVDDADG